MDDDILDEALDELLDGGLDDRESGGVYTEEEILRMEDHELYQRVRRLGSIKIEGGRHIINCPCYNDAICGLMEIGGQLECNGPILKRPAHTRIALEHQPWVSKPPGKNCKYNSE